MSIQVHLEYEIALHSGTFHVGSGLQAAAYADRLVVRDARGLPYLPGASVKGAVRDATARIAANLGLPICAAGGGDANQKACEQGSCVMCRLFGSVLFPGPLRFGDARFVFPTGSPLQGEAASRFVPLWFEVRNGVQICRQRRVAQEQHKYNIEWARVAPGALLQAKIVGRVSDNSDYQEYGIPMPPTLWTLLCGLLLTDHFGGGRSRGAGAAAIQIKALRVGGKDFPDWRDSLSGGDLLGYYREHLAEAEKEAQQ